MVFFGGHPTLISVSYIYQNKINKFTKRNLIINRHMSDHACITCIILKSGEKTHPGYKVELLTA